MTTIVTRSGKGSPLTHVEVDANFTNLNNDKSETTHTHTSSAVTDFTEAAQDAVGAMVDASLTYVDATPLLQRAALTGAVTASAGSNATALGSFTKAQLTTAVSDGDPLYVGDVSAITLQDEGSNITTGLTTLNVVGLGAVASGNASATLTINGLVTAAPSSDQADWAPSGFGAGTGTIKAQPTSNCFLTGITAGATDQKILLVNDSDYVICVEGESGASTAANRFRKRPRTMWILPQQSMSFRYSATSSRWVFVSESLPLYLVDHRGHFIVGHTGSTPGGIGVPGALGTATISTINLAATPTDDFLEHHSLQVTNSTAAGTSSVRDQTQPVMRGASANRQGFFHAGMVRFTALGVTGAVRAGMMASTAVSTTLNNATTNCLLLGAQTTDTNLRVYSGDAAAGTPVDLGANFPAPHATASYEYCFYAPTNSSFVRYMVRRLDTRFVASGSLTSNLPVNTTALGMRVEIMVGATATASTAQAAYLYTQGL